MATTPLPRIDRAASNPPLLARKAIKDPRLIDDIIGGLEAETPRTKYGCAKALRAIAEGRPDLLYPRFEFFTKLLDHTNNILQWEALFVLSHLARVDEEDQCAAILDKYLAPIRGPVMITAANAIRGGGRIARAKPSLADRITAEVLQVAKARYQTAECRNVAIGHAIVTLGEIADLVADSAALLKFVRNQVNNERPATRKKAEQFLKRTERRGKDFAP